MWSSSRRVLQDLAAQCHAKLFSQTTCKNTVVVERWWQVPLSQEGRPPRLHPRRHRIYKLVEDTKQAPQQRNMELILTQTVAKLGGRGDTVFVKKSLGRNKLLPQGLAVYASPENKLIFAEEIRLLHEGKPEERIQTRTGQLTVEFLKRIQLKINKGPSVDYELTKDIVRRQLLKKFGVVMPPHALRIPDEPIRDQGQYWCEVTVNGIDTVRIPISLLPYEDQSAEYRKMLKKQRQELADVAPTVEASASETVVAVMGERGPKASTSPAADVIDKESTASPGSSEAPNPSGDKTEPPAETPQKD